MSMCVHLLLQLCREMGYECLLKLPCFYFYIQDSDCFVLHCNLMWNLFRDSMRANMNFICIHSVFFASAFCYIFIDGFFAVFLKFRKKKKERMIQASPLELSWQNAAVWNLLYHCAYPFAYKYIVSHMSGENNSPKKVGVSLCVSKVIFQKTAVYRCTSNCTYTHTHLYIYIYIYIYICRNRVCTNSPVYIKLYLSRTLSLSLPFSLSLSLNIYIYIS